MRGGEVAVSLPGSPRTWGLAGAALALLVAWFLPIWYVWHDTVWEGVIEYGPLSEVVFSLPGNLRAAGAGGILCEWACWDAAAAALVLALGYGAGRLAYLGLSSGQDD